MDTWLPTLLKMILRRLIQYKCDAPFATHLQTNQFIYKSTDLMQEFMIYNNFKKKKNSYPEKATNM